MTNDVEYLFMYLLVICLLLWKNVHSGPLPIVLIRMFDFFDVEL